jgi:DNA (cytosine-5)-methyltransferase 1
MVSHSAVDLFCGVGGLTHGLRLAGLNVVAGIDLDQSCQYAYEYNNFNSRFIQAYILSINHKYIKNLHQNNSIHILVGCAPCQSFSKYTKRYRKDNILQPNKIIKYDIDSKWKLLNSFRNIIKYTLPDIVSMENVPEIKNEQIFTDFCDLLLLLNYNINYSIINCQEYGVPQSRKRLVLLASKFGEIKLIPPLFTEDKWPTVKSCIGDLPPILAGEQNVDDRLHTASALSAINLRRIRNSIPGGTWHAWDDDLRLKCHKKNSGRTYTSIYGRMDWDTPSPTITTQFFGYGNGRFGHPEQDRALSLREGALLQTFPHNYEFIAPTSKFNRRNIAIHIGNAVPVELGRAIGNSILKHISNCDKNVK